VYPADVSQPREARTQRPLHDREEPEVWPQVNSELALGLCPLELPHEIGHEVAKMEHGDAHAGTHPPADTKW